MGYIRHHAIIVTGPVVRIRTARESERIDISDVQTRCKVIAAKHSNQGLDDFTQIIGAVIESPMNAYGSFLVAPDGSKEGWATSTAGDALRDEIIEYLETLRYSDQSTSFDYVELMYGDDNGEVKITRGADL